MPIVVVQNATVLDLKKAICRFMELKEREGGVKQVNWGYVWRTFLLVVQGEKLDDDKMRLKDYGIRNMDKVMFMKRHMKKVHTGHTPDGQYTQEDVGLSWIPLGPRLKVTAPPGCDAPVGSSGEGVAMLHPASLIALIAVTQGTWKGVQSDTIIQYLQCSSTG
ncbi:hypothetical protein NQZ68_038635 [Dissostichus eleginoides]|nr:hypothetical protein NQZ68_038635 [Dissostichus eleginoides]